MNDLPRAVINLGAGPSCLPLNVLEEAQRGLLNYGNTGMGVTELSHRSKTFMDLNARTEADLRALLEVPDDYRVIFMQGGGLTQFGAVPINLLAAYRIAHQLKPEDQPPVEYLVTGSWSAKAAKEASELLGLNVNVVTDGRKASADGKTFGAVQDESEWSWTSSNSALKTAYIYYCANETVNGVEIDPPNVPAHLRDVPLAIDMSSNILSKPIAWRERNIGLVYAGAQKNIGPAGLTIVIVREDLVVDLHEAAVKYGGFRVPAMLSYKALADAASLYNTPPMFAIYVAGLVFADLRAKGGVAAADKLAAQKSERVYGAIEASNGFYIPRAAKGVRSRMNVVFVCKGGESVDAQFVSDADKRGIKQVKGHRSVGGIRTSLYNAVTLSEVDALVAFMTDFAQSHS